MFPQLFNFNFHFILLPLIYPNLTFIDHFLIFLNFHSHYFPPKFFPPPFFDLAKITFNFHQSDDFNFDLQSFKYSNQSKEKEKI
jgi:hypothetical protein